MNNTEKQALPDGWEALLVSRWQRGKTPKKNDFFYYTLWTRIQIRGKGEKPDTLSLYITGTSSKWQRAGTLKRQGDEWKYHPTQTSDTPAILEATIVRFLASPRNPLTP